LVVVSLGTNDAGGVTSRKFFPHHAEWVIREIHKYKAKVVWVTAPKTKIDTGFADNYILGESKADGIFHTKCLDLPLMVDRVHPTIPASRAWAGMVWTYLKTGVRPCASFRFRWPQVHSGKLGLTLTWTF
jgi:lysophospholipase L1-like esterase